MPNTDLGKHAIAGYARYLNTTPADFIRSMNSAASPDDVAAGVAEILGNPEQSKGKVFVVSGQGLEAAS